MTQPAFAAPGAAIETAIDDDLVGRVDAELRRYFARRRPELDAIAPVTAEVTEALTEFVLLGGKRVRPTFAWWGWRGAGGGQEPAGADPVLAAISALELIQANALIHDDLMDDSDTRRGRPTVHVTFTRRHRERGWLGPSERFGAAAAILVGDLALAWADDMFSGADLPEPARRRAHPVWAGMRGDMLGGQFLDVWGQASGDESEETALRVCQFKTAAYTVQRPLLLGATLAGADDALLAAYHRFGADIGVAFQLRDDLLGVYGDPAVTGKPAGDDLREGKRTLLMAHAMRAARERRDPAALDALNEALGNPGLDAPMLDRVRELLETLGATDQIERDIERLTGAALDALAEVPVAEPAATRLPELAHAATRRRY